MIFNLGGYRASDYHDRFVASAALWAFFAAAACTCTVTSLAMSYR
jgi:hypothetical protein